MKDIKGFEGLYAVTKDGRVWSYPRIIINKTSQWGKPIKRKWKGHWLKTNTTKKGDWYMSISLQRDNRKFRKGFKKHLCGDQNPNHKISDKQVEEIRKRFKNGEHNKSQLGREFGVSHALIRLIVANKIRHNLNTSNQY